MSLFSIPGIYENECPLLALWSIGHGPSFSYARIVFSGFNDSPKMTLTKITAVEIAELALKLSETRVRTLLG